MSVIEYIILSIALTIPTMVVMRACALKNRIRLTKGMAFSFLIALEHTLLLLLGIFLGNMLRFDLPEFDNLIYLGFMVAVALRMFFPAFRKKSKKHTYYDISRLSTVLLLGVATGTNTLFVGLGLGFRVLIERDLWRAAIPMMVVMFLLCYLSIMMGRQKKTMNERKWQLIAVLFLLIFAIKGAFFGD